MFELAEDYKNWDVYSDEKKVERNGLVNACVTQLSKWKEMQSNEDLTDNARKNAEFDILELAEYIYKDWDISSEEKKKNLGILISADVLRLLKRKKARGEVAEASHEREDRKIAEGFRLLRDCKQNG